MGADTAYLLVMIQGASEDLGDVAYAPEVGEQISRRFGAGVKKRFEEVLGWNFNAGVDE